MSVGLIPAHAGKTLIGGVGSVAYRAHPRSRGENVGVRDHESSPWGSSPLTRGKRRALVGPSRLSRLIPAHAGKTADRLRDVSEVRAHPRSRGENGTRSDLAYVSEGSSPLTRGKHPFADGFGVAGGLIPAHAGKTREHRRGQTRPGAHPRSRGENEGHIARPRRELGSSPLTRGKLGGDGVVGLPVGLIPAHAGKTIFVALYQNNETAHPRSRGENHAASTAALNVSGSSPLTRGKPPAAGYVVRRGGLIPAHAGKTCQGSR